MAQMTLGQLATVAKDPAIKAALYSMLRQHAILETAQILPANKVFSHNYKSYVSLPTVGYRPHGEGFSKSKPDRKREQIDLQQVGVIHEEDDYIIKSLNYMTPEDFFMAEAPTYYEAMARYLSKAVIKGEDENSVEIFHSFENYAATNSLTEDASGSGAGTTDLYVVRWQPQVTGILVNPAVLADVMNLVNVEIMPLKNKELDNDKGQAVRQVNYSAAINLLNNSKTNIGHYKDIRDNSGNLPTEKKLDMLIKKVKASPKDSFIYTSGVGSVLLNSLKTAKLNMVPKDTDFNTIVGYFNGIPILEDDNISVEA